MRARMRCWRSGARIPVEDFDLGEALEVARDAGFRAMAAAE